MAPDPESSLKSLHDLYCSLTGRNLTYQFYQREWADFAKTFTADDLRTVLTWVERENSKRERQFRIRTDLLRIIGGLAVFDSLKAEAELEAKAKAAKGRAWRASESDKTLAEFRKTEPQPPEAPPRMSKELIINGLDKLRNDLERQ